MSNRDNRTAGRGDVVTPTGQTSILPAKGLVHALSEIQFLSRGEKQAGDYDPEMLLTLTVLYSFLWEGFIATIIPLIFSFFSLPIGLAAVKKLLPAFGTYERSLLDNILVLFVSFSPSALKIFFVAYIISQCYLGKTTKKLLTWFVFYSMIPTLLLVSVIMFFIYQFIYFYVLSEENLYKIFLWLGQNISNITVIKTLNLILFSLKATLIECSIFFVLTVVFEVLFLVLAFLYADRKTKKYKQFLMEWGLRKDIEL